MAAREIRRRIPGHAGLEMAKTALQLDPDEAYGHLATGFALLYLHRFRQAEISLDRAVALNPNDPFILSIRALLLNYTNRPEEGLREIYEAQRRDPFALGWYEDFRGIILTTAGQYREAAACYQKMASIPSCPLEARRDEEAVAGLERPFAPIFIGEHRLAFDEVAELPLLVVDRDLARCRFPDA